MSAPSFERAKERAPVRRSRFPMSMVKEMETTYDIELPATLLFEYSTLNELVEYLKTEVDE